MVKNSKVNALTIPLKKFIPIFFLEIIITSTVGSLSTAISNHLISELKYAPWVGAIIVSLVSAGFLVFTLAFGHISDKFGQRKVIIFIMIGRLGCSLFYLVPISSNIHLIIFGFIFFFDGGANGIFWPTIQNLSVLTERFGGLTLKQKFLSGYNFSWNFGYIFGMFAGTIIVFLFTFNYNVFYFNAFGLIIGVIIAIFSTKSIFKFFNNDTLHGSNSQDTPPTKNSAPYIKDEQSSITPRLFKLPFYSILLVLLIHSLIDGVMTIFLTIKIDLINQDLYWVFLITLIKLFAQMVATMIFSFTKKNKIAKFILISISMVAISWILIILSNDLWTLALLLSISGFAQGMIYVLMMNLISYRARDKNSAKPFSYFQAMMSSGRMTGSLYFGLTTTIFLNLGVIFLILYIALNFIQFNMNLKYASRN